MIICIEGPDCSGKTTQAKLLEEHIKKNYPNMKPIYIHFPTHEREDIKAILHESSTVANPFFIASAYMNDFFVKIKTERLIPYGNDNETITYKTVEELANSSKYIFIFDRYYYSSLIMCTNWPNRYTNLMDIQQNQENVKDWDEKKEELVSKKDQLLKEKDEYLKNVFGITGLLLKKFELPAPDLNILILPDVEIVNARLAAKIKDNFESSKMVMNFYASYASSVNGGYAVFKMNNELMPPVVIRDSRTIKIECLGNTLASIMKNHSIKVKGNTRTIDEIHKNIVGVVEDYFDIRKNKSINFSEDLMKNIPDIKFFIESWKNDTIEDFDTVPHYQPTSIKKEEKPTILPNKPEENTKSKSSQSNGKPKTPKMEDVKPVVKEEPKNLKTLFTEDEIEKMINEADSKILTNCKILYGFTDKDFCIYTKFNFEIDKLIEEPDQYIPSNEYNTRDRIDVVTTMIKMLEIVELNKKYNPEKLKTIIKYLRSKIEAIGMHSISTEGVK